MKNQELKINTEYSLGDEVWWMEDNKLKSGIIASVHSRIYQNLTFNTSLPITNSKGSVEYTAFEGDNRFVTTALPADIFPSKEKLVEHLTAEE